MILDQWAIKWGIPHQAIVDLRAAMGAAYHTTIQPTLTEDEAGVMARVRLEASRLGVRLWRNNVGTCQDQSGNFIRYGLANDSKRMNDHIKSSDLVGIRPIQVTPEMVGGVVGQFCAREVKRSGWKYKGSKREQAQKRFLELVVAMGGDARFVNDEGSL